MKKPFQANIDKIACENNYNMFPENDDPLVWERFYDSQYETNLGPIIRQLVNRKYPFTQSARIISIDEKWELSKQIVVQLLRTKYARTFFNSVVDKEWDSTKTDIINNIDQPYKNEASRLIESLRVKPKVILNLGLKHFNRQNTIDQYANFFFSRNWLIYRNSHQGFPFITSDNPIAFKDVTEGAIRLGEFGLSDEGYFTFYPLSPFYCIVVCPQSMNALTEDLDRTSVDADIRNVLEINLAEVHSSLRQIYTNMPINHFK